MHYTDEDGSTFEIVLNEDTGKLRKGKQIWLTEEKKCQKESQNVPLKKELELTIEIERLHKEAEEHSKSLGKMFEANMQLYLATKDLREDLEEAYEVIEVYRRNGSLSGSNMTKITSIKTKT